MNNIKPIIGAACILMLSACNSDYNEPSTEQLDPETTAAPVTNFPVQSATPLTFNAGDAGSILVTESGLSLYFFANDEQGVSNCNAEDGAPSGGFTDAESCAGRWPPLLVADNVSIESPFSSIERADGTMQWALHGYSLYQFGQDTAQGDILGDGLGDVWDLARNAPFESNIDKLVANNTLLSASNVAGTLETQRLEKQGFSLYTFDGDAIDTANCFDLGDGGCINTWPPLLADNAAKPFGLYGVASQTNGFQQWTFRGKPLYLFTNDLGAGETNGQGAGGNFFLATKKPAIQRDINGTSWLSATGQISLLTANAGAELTVQIADKDQFSLYTFANDEAGVSNCSVGGCLENWPAFLASEFDTPYGAFGIFEREDGNMQWTYEDMPLYFFQNDIAIDDVNGHEVGDVWFLIPPASTEVAAQTSPLGNTLKIEGWAKTLQVNDDNEFVVIEEDNSGRQLYTFDVDGANDSNCDSTACIGNWPALLVKETDQVQAPFSIVIRDDGYQQWALNGKPLYLFTPDTIEGDQLGEGIGGVWYIARPASMRLSTIDGVGEGFVAHRLDIESSDLNDVTKEGFTLYTFGNDVADSGVSACSGGCATVWPPLYAKADSQAYGAYTIIQRSDGDGNPALQWAYAGKPLYFFKDDTAIGQANGNNQNTFVVATVN